MSDSAGKHEILEQLRRGTLQPYVLLLLATTTIIVVLLLSSFRLNEFSGESSRHIFDSVLKNESDGLGRLTKDYSFWYEAVEKLTIDYSPEWVDSNLQEYLHDAFSISRVIINRADRSVITSIHEGAIEYKVPADVFGHEMASLFDKASETDMSDPVPATGLLWIENHIHIVAICPLTPDIEYNDLDQNRAYGFLVFTKVLDDELLSQWGEDFQLSNLKLNSSQVNLPEKHIAIDLYSPLDRWIASVSLQPMYPGDLFLRLVLPWVLVFAVVIFLLSLLFIFRVRRSGIEAGQTLDKLHESQKQLHISQQQLQYVIDGANLGYWDWNYLTDEYQMNNRWLEMLGLSGGDINNHMSDWEERIHPDDRERMIQIVNEHIRSGHSYVADFRMRHKDGHWVWIQGSGSVVEYESESGHAMRLCGTHQDISKRKEIDIWLEEQATHDPLTGLYNRVEMEKYFIKELERAKRHNQELSLFMIDIDHFKKINDSYGHQAGDRVLQKFSRYLETAIRNIDYVARFGGEEFVVILPDTKAGDVEAMADRLRREVLEIGSPIGADEIGFTITIGIATFPANGLHYDDLLQEADSAMYAAKRSGRNCVRHASNVKNVFTPDVFSSRSKSSDE